MKAHHVYRPPRPNRLLSSVVIFGGGALLTFLVFYFIPLMQKLAKQEEEPEPDLVPVITQKQKEYQPPEPPEEPKEEPEPPEITEVSDEIPIDAPDLSALVGGTGRVMLNITPSVNLAGSGAVDTGGVDSEPVPTFKATPSVPPAVRKTLASRGAVRVVVSGMVDERGRVVEASVAQGSGITALDQAAVKALQQYKFKPAIRNGRKAKARVKLPFDFRVQK